MKCAGGFRTEPTRFASIIKCDIDTHTTHTHREGERDRMNSFLLRIYLSEDISTTNRSAKEPKCTFARISSRLFCLYFSFALFTFLCSFFLFV